MTPHLTLPIVPVKSYHRKHQPLCCLGTSEHADNWGSAERWWFEKAITGQGYTQNLCRMDLSESSHCKTIMSFIENLTISFLLAHRLKSGNRDLHGSQFNEGMAQ